MIEGTCACGNYAVASEGQVPRCLMCVREDHGLTETPADRFRRTPVLERRERYALPLGSTGKGFPPSRRPEEEGGSSGRVAPPPEYTSRMPWPDGVKVPRGAEEFAAGARACGWLVVLTYAQGWALPVRLVDPPYRVASVAVRFQQNLGGGRARGGHVVYVTRLDRTAKWEAKSLMVFGSDHWPIVGPLRVTDVGRYLVDGRDWTGAEVAAWGDALRLKVAQAKERAAEAAKARGRKPKTEVS